MAFCKKAVESMAIGALALVPITAVAAEEAVAIEIFTPVGTMEDHRIRAERPGSLASLHDAETDRSESRHAEVLRNRSVVVDLSELAAVRERLQERGPVQIRLDLFSDVDLIANIARTARTQYGYSLSGQIDGDPHGSVTLVVHGDVLAGAVHSREGTYVIAAENGAIHSVRETSGDFLCQVDGRSHDAAFGQRPLSQGKSARSDDDGSVVDLLVLFTQAALDVEGTLRRMRAGIDLAVAWTNDAYEAGGIGFRLNLVGAALVAYEETSEFGAAGVSNQHLDLDHMFQVGDGLLEEAHTLREAYAADTVHLVVDQPGGGGAAKLLRADEADPSAYGFSISNSLLKRPELLAHELGHVMGLLHDRYEEADSGWVNAGLPLPAYAHGYVNQRAFDAGAPEESRWRTIMAYPTQCRHEGFECRHIQRFSNPDEKYPAKSGDSLGVPGEGATESVHGPADAARGLNETRSLIAGFRESATRCDYRLSQVSRNVPALRRRVHSRDRRRAVLRMDGGRFWRTH